MTDNPTPGEATPMRSPDGARLTPEQIVGQYKPFEHIDQEWRSKLVFASTQSFAWSKIAAEAARTSQLAARALAPFASAQQAWARQASIVSSDYFKSNALSQTQFAALSTSLSRTVDFGLNPALRRLAEQYAREQTAWLRAIPKFPDLKGAFYPPNLRTIDDLMLAEVEKVVMADGIALYGLPRSSIAEALLRAESAAKRREILGRRWKAISADCREAVECCSDASVMTYVPFARAVLDALDEGHSVASQALVGSLLDTIVRAFFGARRRAYTPSRRTKTADAYDEFSVRQFIALAPIWQAWQQFYPEKADPVPGTFSRNATAHTVSSRQFNRRNAVQGAMLACSLIYFLDEQSVARAA